MVRWIRQNMTLFGIGLLLLIVGGVLALIDQRGTLNSPGPLPTSPEGEPDYVLEQVDYTHFNTEGAPYQTLTSPRIVHLPNTRTSHADQPVIGLIDDAHRQWKLTGRDAILQEDDTHIALSGDARVEAPEQQWRLETDTLEYQRSDDHLWSNSGSTFYQGPQTIRSDRFDAWLQAGTMNLTGNVIGEFEPTP